MFFSKSLFHYFKPLSPIALNSFSPTSLYHSLKPLSLISLPLAQTPFSDLTTFPSNPFLGPRCSTLSNLFLRSHYHSLKPLSWTTLFYPLKPLSPISLPLPQTSSPISLRNPQTPFSNITPAQNRLSDLSVPLPQHSFFNITVPLSQFSSDPLPFQTREKQAREHPICCIIFSCLNENRLPMVRWMTGQTDLL